MTTTMMDQSSNKKTAKQQPRSLVVVACVALGLVAFIALSNGDSLYTSSSNIVASNRAFAARHLGGDGNDDVDIQSGTKQTNNEDEEKEEQERLVKAMKARMLTTHKLDLEAESSVRYSPNQFLHLHHMKTGGTSMDQLIRCSLENARRLPSQDESKSTAKSPRMELPYKSLHECSAKRWQSCVAGTDGGRCQNDAAASTIMSYCAPLRYLPTFGWNQRFDDGTLDDEAEAVDGFGAVTVLRNPVERVWSMYRFQTKNCYECRPLLDIYKEMDAGTSGLREMCQLQLSNHQVANLLSTESSLNASDDEKVVEAIHNMKYFFTMIGLTEELPATVQMLDSIFPWLNDTTKLVDYPVDTEQNRIRTCTLPHANASPRNNRCGPGNTHMALPDHPDAKTKKAIEEHNKLDMELYQAAVKHFKLQKEVMGLDKK